MRPATLDEVVGQDHLLAARRAAAAAGRGRRAGLGGAARPARHREDDSRAAHLAGDRPGVRGPLGAVTPASRRSAPSSTSPAARLTAPARRTVLFIDEVHRFSRTQQDALLAAVEDRIVLLVGRRPRTRASRWCPRCSRAAGAQLHALDDDACAAGRPRGRRPARPRRRRDVDRRARAHLVRLSGGDGRRALTALEAAADGASADGARDRPAAVERAVDRGHRPLRPRRRPALRRDQRVHQVDPRLRSRRRAALPRPDDRGGGGPALHRPPARRARQRGRRARRPGRPAAAVAAAQAVQLIGMPEARIALAQATVHLATAPKSNAVIVAIDEAIADVRCGAAGPVPAAPARRALRGRGPGPGTRSATVPPRRPRTPSSPSSTRPTTRRPRLLPAGRAGRSGCSPSGCAPRLREVVRGGSAR